MTVFNDGGSLQIDSNYFNVYIESVKDIASGKYPTQTPFDNHADTPLFAIQPTPNGLYTIVFKSTNFENNRFKLYGISDTPSQLSSNFGLEVYRADGSVSFSSKNKGLKIIDYVKTNVKQSQNDIFFSKNYGSNNIAVIPAVLPIGFVPGQAGSAIVYSIAFSIQSGVLSAKKIAFATASAGFLDRARDVYDVEFLVIDVSNY